MLFLSGTRNELANLDLLEPVCGRLGNLATLHRLDTADHGYNILKRSRTSEEDVFREMALPSRNGRPRSTEQPDCASENVESRIKLLTMFSMRR